ncbi:N2227-domain-containing protein [Marasmius fiardii PR-910]|nr:N2227-domain-containing protein [Marasmius fiardii PR-910]
MALDLVLACFLPVLIAFVTYKLLPLLTWADICSLLSWNSQNSLSNSPFSLENAYHSYRRYRQLSGDQLMRMQQAYSTVNRRHKRIGYDIGYPAKLKRLQETTEINALVTDGIASLAEEEFELKDDQWLPTMNSGNISRVRESLKHFIRDWSAEGKSERDRIFLPILQVLQLVEAGNRPGKKVLVPGSGLGRLAWDISQLGFDTTANELSFFMNLSFRFLLSPKTTTSIDQHALHPYGYWFSHQKSNDALFRAIRFPDVVPHVTGNLHLSEGDFLALSPAQGYDYVVTLFFIDTSTNVLATLDQIHTLLRPGGLWINLGPLLWCSGSQARLELSLDEVFAAARATGFTIVEEDECMKPRTVPCEYTHDAKAMMKWIYQAEFWVARK